MIGKRDPKKNARSKARNLVRKREHIERDQEIQRKWRMFGPKAQLAELDRRFGKGIGAGKQRHRIALRLQEQAA